MNDPRRVRRLLVEALEDRLSPALLVPGGFVEAFSRHQDLKDGPTSRTGTPPISVSAQAGPASGSFQSLAEASISAGGLLTGRSQSGGVFPAQNPTDPTVQSSSTSRLVENWIVTGVPRGTPVTIQADVSVAGLLTVVDYAGVGAPDHIASIGVAMTFSADQQSDQKFLDVGTSHSFVVSENGLSFSPVSGSPGSVETNSWVVSAVTL